MDIIRLLEAYTPWNPQEAQDRLEMLRRLRSGEELLTSTDLLRIRRHHYLGETMEIVLWRDGLRLNVTLQLTQSVD